MEIWCKICDILFLLFNYNIYICSQIKTIYMLITLKNEQYYLLENII